MNSNLSVQLLGKFQIIEKVVKENDGLFVSLTNFQLKEQLRTFRSQASSFPHISESHCSKEERGRKRLKTTTSGIFCATCCKSIHAASSMKFKDAPEVLRTFLEIVMISTDEFGSTFSKYQLLPFCQNCHSAIKFLVATFCQIKELETQVREMTKKMKSVVQLSMSIHQKENWKPKAGNTQNGWDSFREAIIKAQDENRDPVRKLKVVIQKHVPIDQLSEGMSDWECDNSLPVLSPSASLQELSLPDESKDTTKTSCLENKNTDWLKIEVEDKEEPNHKTDFSLDCSSSSDTVSKQLDDSNSGNVAASQSNEKSNSSNKSKRTWQFAGMTSSHKKGLDNVRSFRNLPPEKLSQKPWAVRWRKLRAEHPEMSQKELKAFIRKQNDERKLVEETRRNGTGKAIPQNDSATAHLKSSITAVVQNDDTSSPQNENIATSQNSSEVSSEKSNRGRNFKGFSASRRKGLDNARSSRNLPPKSSQLSEAMRALRAEHPEMTQRELKALLKKQNAEETALGLTKGLAHKQSFVNKPPEQLSQTYTARYFRNLRLQYPDKSIRELTEIRENTSATENRGYAYRERPKCETTEDGRMFYKNVEIKKLESGLYVCTKCDIGKTGSTLIRSLMFHINLRHVPRHKCSTCGKSFQRLHDLNLHSSNCLKKEDPMCHLCGITFRDRSSRSVHIRVVHQGIKPHTCEHCPKSFATRKDLTIHQRRHTGERPFVCHVCGTTFIEKQSMKKHIRNRHPEAVESEIETFHATEEIQQQVTAEVLPNPQTSNEKHIDDNALCSGLISGTVSNMEDNVTEKI